MGLIDGDRSNHQNGGHHWIKHPKIGLKTNMQIGLKNLFFCVTIPIDRIANLEDYIKPSMNDRRPSTQSSGQEKSRRSSIQMQQQIIAEVSMFPNSSNRH